MFTAEQRAANSERLKAYWADYRAKKAAGTLPPRTPKPPKPKRHSNSPSIDMLSERGAYTVTAPRGVEEKVVGGTDTATATASSPHRTTTNVEVLDMRVDWDHIPLPHAQALFGKLKAELDRAARSMNQRLSERPSYPCSAPGCGHLIKDGEEKFKDCAYIPARYICSERCYMTYTQLEMQRKHAARTRT